MSRKNKILTVIGIVLLLGVGFVLYRTFFPSPPADVAVDLSDGSAAANPLNATPTPAGTVSTTGASTGPAPVVTMDSNKILPLGTKFDLSLVKKYNADGKLYSYPKVSPVEVGPALNELIKKSQ